MPNKEHKKKRYEVLAEVTKIFSSPRRLEILDALIQRDASVEEIAKLTTQSVATTSQHLQVLKQGCVVETQRQGTTIVYSLHPTIKQIFVHIRQFAEQMNPELQLLAQQQQIVPLVNFGEVQKKLEANAVLLDVRSPKEFAFSHMAGAVNIPLPHLGNRLHQLSTDQEIIVTCRGPYCVSSVEAIQVLQQNNFIVFHYTDGVGEWQMHGGSILRSETDAKSN